MIIRPVNPKVGVGKTTIAIKFKRPGVFILDRI